MDSFLAFSRPGQVQHPTARWSTPTWTVAWLLRWVRQLRTIPASTQILHQGYGEAHPLHLKTIQSLLVRQQRSLGDEYVNIGVDSRIVPALFKLELELRGIHRLLLLLNLLGQDAYFGERVFHLLKCGQHRLPVGS